MGKVDTRLLGAPVNRTAAIVTGKGFSRDWNLKGGHVTWDAPQPTRQPTSKAQDYRGLTFGRMTVIGLLRDMPNRWLCRCSCGRYEPRRAKAIRNKNNHRDACRDCQTLHERKRQAVRTAFYQKHGCWPDESNGVEAQRIRREWDR